MLTYATIFIVCIFVAVIALVIYRAITESSRSVYSSKVPISIMPATPQAQKYAVPAAPNPSDQSGFESSVNASSNIGAAPNPNVNWGRQASRGQVREQGSNHAKSGDNSKHCSLYDVDPTAPSANRNSGWLHREEKRELGDTTAYKVTRKRPASNDGSGDASKPWGW